MRELWSRRREHSSYRVFREFEGPLAAVGIAFFMGSVLLLLLGKNPIAVYGAMMNSMFGSAYGLGQVLFKTTTLLGTGLAVAIAFRAGFFNIGVEGQMFLGGLGGAVVALLLPDWMPSFPGALLVMLVAGVVGACWAGIPGLLKAWLGVHEVINTIMMNFIAFALGSYLLVEHFAVFETVHTAAIPQALHFSRLENFLPAFHGAPVNLVLPIQIAFCVVMFVVFRNTRWGFEIRCVGASPDAARSAGIPVARRMIQAMMLSGCVAGMTAANFVQGYKYYFEEGFTAEAGFKGIAVALLARSQPLSIIPAALLFGALDRGAFGINQLVPKEFVDILQAMVILLVIIFVQKRTQGFLKEKAESARKALEKQEGSHATD